LAIRFFIRDTNSPCCRHKNPIKIPCYERFSAKFRTYDEHHALSAVAELLEVAEPWRWSMTEKRLKKSEGINGGRRIALYTLRDI
jgi:hypothetical protein